jgi:actin-related protein
MYCGDEVAAIVGDVGYSNARFGFAGEDMPKALLPGQVRNLDFLDRTASFSFFTYVEFAHL